MTKVITVTRKNGDVHEILVDDDFEAPARLYISGVKHNAYVAFTKGEKK